MPQHEADQGIMPSLLDRLLDPDSVGTAWRRGYGVEQMVRTVERDLEELLNTRQSQGDLAAGFVELHNSLLAYGLPDLMTVSVVTPQQRQGVAHLIEEVISRFEPRLRNVHATVVSSPDSTEMAIRFRIQATVCLDPAPSVAFDTVLQLSTGRYSITGRSMA